jgi:NAD(P)-dependent dehydrogenase (short-subunit alcohol dehydrogenase family)
MLQDEVVIVSGIGPGLGQELACAAVREGAQVALADCANAVMFFASDLSRVITGAGPDVNGGEFMP